MKRLADKPFALVGVNSDPDREAVMKRMKEEQMTWPNWWDDGRIDGPIHQTWQIAERPAIHILDARGVIRYKGIQPDEIDAAIDTLLDELAASGK